MAISEGMLSVVAAGINWVTDKMGPSKKEMRLKISDLEQELVELSKGNATLANNTNLMINAIIARLKENAGYTINIDVDTITLTGVNNGMFQTENKRTETINNYPANEDSNIVKIEEDGNDDDEPFFVSDEELARIRIKKD